MQNMERVKVHTNLSLEKYNANKIMLEKIINAFLDEELSKPDQKEELNTVGYIDNVGMCAVYRDNGQIYLNNFAPAIA